MIQHIHDFYPLISSLLAMNGSQIIKLVIFGVVHGKWRLNHLFYSGGMPSSHSALVIGLASAIGLKYGWTSGTFSIAIAFSLIVLYDSAGVRHAVGQQAKTINTIIAALNTSSQPQLKRTSEVMGHTPIEIAVGALVGLSTSIALHLFLKGAL